MLDAAFFVAPKPIAREVELPDGTKHKLFFRELPVTDFRLFQLAERSANDNERAGSIAKLISMSLATEDGKLVLTYEKALQLNQAAANALTAAVLDVNGYEGGRAKKA